MRLNTIELIQKSKEISPLGFEVSLSMGILNTTKYVFYKRKRFYVFSAEEHWNFSWDIGYNEFEFIKNYKKWIWRVDQTIS